MIPDLGKYAGAVLSSYALSVALLALLVAMTLWKGRRARRALDAIERKDRTDG